jgi:hypothetical protein
MQPAGVPTARFGRQGASWEAGYAMLFLISDESFYLNAQPLLLNDGRLGGIVRGSCAWTD